MSDNALAKSKRLSIFHPKIYINALIMLVVGSFNSVGQKVLFDKKYGNFRHPVWTNVGMFYGEYLNYIVFMILCMIPKTFKKINKDMYKKVIFKTFILFSNAFLIKRKQLKRKSSIPHFGELDSEEFAIVLDLVSKLLLSFSSLLQFTVLEKMQLLSLQQFSQFSI